MRERPSHGSLHRLKFIILNTERLPTERTAHSITHNLKLNLIFKSKQKLRTYLLLFSKTQTAVLTTPQWKFSIPTNFLDLFY